MPLNDDQVQEVGDWLNANTRKACPMCGGSNVGATEIVQTPICPPGSAPTRRGGLGHIPVCNGTPPKPSETGM
jgi:hypothetical protein